MARALPPGLLLVSARVEAGHPQPAGQHPAGEPDDALAGPPPGVRLRGRQRLHGAGRHDLDGGRATLVAAPPRATPAPRWRAVAGGGEGTRTLAPLVGTLSRAQDRRGVGAGLPAPRRRGVPPRRGRRPGRAGPATERSEERGALEDAHRLRSTRLPVPTAELSDEELSARLHAELDAIDAAIPLTTRRGDPPGSGS